MPATSSLLLLQLCTGQGVLPHIPSWPTQRAQAGMPLNGPSPFKKTSRAEEHKGSGRSFLRLASPRLMAAWQAGRVRQCDMPLWPMGYCSSSSSHYQRTASPTPKSISSHCVSRTWQASQGLCSTLQAITCLCKAFILPNSYSRRLMISANSRKWS